MPSNKPRRASVRKTRYNRIVRSGARMAVRTTRRAIEAGTREESLAALSRAASALDRAAKRGVIHRNNASRRKSRLAMRVHALTRQEG